MKNENHYGIGFTSSLTIVFIILKLLGVIDWSWIWVLSPIWITWIFLTLVLSVIYWFVEYIDGKEDDEDDEQI